MKTISYLRVSTIDQDIEKNKTDILKLANEKQLGNVIFVEEKISGTVSWKKRKIHDIVYSLTAGDNIIVSELSRLGRSMLECMEILSIATEKKINIYSVKGNWSLDNSIQSKIIAMAFSMASEIERDLISSRTRESLRIKKLNGMKLGRPVGSGSSKLDEFKVEIEALLNNGSSKRFIAKRYGITEQGLFHWLRKNKEKLEKKS
ncbi:MAG: resolvase [Bacteroidetes bacterium]|nr:MAG: resolvase [Bacteroidota bacterium]